MKPLFSFGLISDCQYADIPDYMEYGPRLFRKSKQKLEEAINHFNNNNLEFVVHLGDLIDQRPESFDPILNICKKSKAPFWHVLGNHDFYGDNYEYMDPKTTMTKLGLKKGYYSKEVKDYRFIVLDTNEEGVIKAKKGTAEYKKGLKIIEKYKKLGRINAQKWNGRISQKQLEWLLANIDEAEKNSKKVIIFSHHGLYPEHRENMLNDKEMLKELANRNIVKAYINGHNHYGDFGVYKKLPCLTVHGVVDTDKNSFAVADVYSDHIKISGFGREPSRSLKIR